MIIKAIRTKELSEFEIYEICKLKNSNWKFGIKSQLNFFNKTYKSNDIHILLLKTKKIIGYNCMRKRNIKFSNEIINYYLFDTLIIDNKFRNRNYGELMMIFNNCIIESENILAILICDKKLTYFYSKFKWNVIKDKIIFKNINKNKFVMIYNDYIPKKLKHLKNIEIRI